jgi:iron complex outermembrane receptor protein
MVIQQRLRSSLSMLARFVAERFIEPGVRTRGSGNTIARLFAAAILTGLVGATAHANSRNFHFYISNQSLSQALRDYGHICGEEVIFTEDVVAGIRTAELRGDYTAQGALRLLLEGTGLVAERSPSGALMIRRGYFRDRAENSLAPLSLERTANTSGTLRLAQSSPPAVPPVQATAPAEESQEDSSKLDMVVVSAKIDTYAEPITTIGSKVPVDQKEIPATIQVLNESFIADKLASSLDDLYPYVVGMTRESPAAAGFTLRGYTNSATNTMINNLTTDGLPGGASRFGSPPTANVERVEVLKGPSSVLYGSMNPGGLINIVTKQPQVRRVNSVFLSGAAYNGNQGSSGTGYLAYIDSTGPIDSGERLLYRLIGSYEDGSTWRQFDWAKNYYIFPSLTYRFTDTTELTVKAEFHRESRFAIQDQALVAPGNLVANVPSDHSIVYQDPGNRAYDRGDVYNLFFSHRFQNEWTAKLSYRYVDHEDGRQILENRSINVATPIANSTITQRLRDTLNTRGYSYGDFNLFGDIGPEGFRNTVLFGLSAGYETHNFRRRIFQNAIGAPISVYNPVHGLTTYPTTNSTTGAGPSQIAVSRIHNYAVYVSDTIHFGEHWIASLGIRTEKYDQKYDDSAVLIATGKVINPGQVNNPKSTVPSVGLVYAPTKALSLYASYAESFKPTPPNSVAFGAPQPDPETANQKEIGVKADFMDRRLGVLLSLYDITRKDVVEPVPNVFDPATGIQVYRSLSNSSKGVELSINFQPVENWQTQIGFSHDDAHVTHSAAAILINADLANAPRNSGNLWTRYNFPGGVLKGFGMGLGIVYTGERNVVVDNRYPQMLTVPSNTRVDTSLYYQWSRYDFALNVTNATDRSYIAGGDAATDLVPGAPRRITASVKAQF